jgi:hypothetical protein
MTRFEATSSSRSVQPILKQTLSIVQISASPSHKCVKFYFDPTLYSLRQNKTGSSSSGLITEIDIFKVGQIRESIIVPWRTIHLIPFLVPPYQDDLERHCKCDQHAHSDDSLNKSVGIRRCLVCFEKKRTHNISSCPSQEDLNINDAFVVSYTRSSDGLFGIS